MKILLISVGLVLCNLPFTDNANRIKVRSSEGDTIKIYHDTLVSNYDANVKIVCLLTSRVIFNDTIRNDECFYDSIGSGRIYARRNYLNGRKNGIQEYYYPTGKRREMSEYCSDVPVGLFLEFWPNGKLKSTRYWDNYIGCDTISLKSVYEEGIDTLENGFVRNYQHFFSYYVKYSGQYTEYDSLGKVNLIENYTNGLKSGEQYFFNDGQLDSVQKFINDSLVATKYY